jgi:hypothetical protein
VVLTDADADASAAELDDRITFVRCLRGELAGIESLLTGAHDRRLATCVGPATAADRWCRR